MILTTTPNIEGFKIAEYKGIVTGVAVKSKKATLTFNMDKYFENYNDTINQIQELAFKNLKENALKLKANAIVGILVDIETVANSGILIVTATGTAVLVAS